ncbi:FGGY family carbohydrate kinase, partial [[Pseudomonas] boreopolis]
MSALYVGLDVGTQSVKLVAYDPEAGEVVSTQSSALALTSAEDGTREQEA